MRQLNEFRVTAQGELDLDLDDTGAAAALPADDSELNEVLCAGPALSLVLATLQQHVTRVFVSPRCQMRRPVRSPYT